MTAWNICRPRTVNFCCVISGRLA